MKTRVLSALLVLAILGCFAVRASAGSTVLRVVVVETSQLDAYLQELEKGKQMMKKWESPGVLRVWKARFAGPNTGSVAVAIEYPSMEALAADEAKLYANPEWQTWLKGLDKLRTIKSDSIYVELKP